MTREFLDKASKTEFYPIIARNTKKLYMSRANGSFLFENKSDAEHFCKKLKNTEVGEKRRFSQHDLTTEMFASGFKHINIKYIGKKVISMPILETDIAVQYYNNETRGAVTLLQQTHYLKYLDKLSASKFITPVHIIPRKEKEYQKIEYCVARPSHDTSGYFVVFTTLGEFIAWNKTQANFWDPVETPLKKLGRIRGKSGIIINPASDQFILTQKELARIKVE